jgi:hypothetical protein
MRTAASRFVRIMRKRAFLHADAGEDRAHTGLLRPARIARNRKLPRRDDPTILHRIAMSVRMTPVRLTGRIRASRRPAARGLIMKHKTWFRLLLKIIGIFLLATAIPSLLNAVTAVMGMTMSAGRGYWGAGPGLDLWTTLYLACTRGLRKIARTLRHHPSAAAPSARSTIRRMRCVCEPLQ